MKEVPVGANKKFLVLMDGNPFAGFDERRDAEGYVGMMKGCIKGGKGNVPAACATKNWSVVER